MHSETLLEMEKLKIWRGTQSPRKSDSSPVPVGQERLGITHHLWYTLPLFLMELPRKESKSYSSHWCPLPWNINRLGTGRVSNSKRDTHRVVVCPIRSNRLDSIAFHALGKTISLTVWNKAEPCCSRQSNPWNGEARQNKGAHSETAWGLPRLYFQRQHAHFLPRLDWVVRACCSRAD